MGKDPAESAKTGANPADPSQSSGQDDFRAKYEELDRQYKKLQAQLSKANSRGDGGVAARLDKLDSQLARLGMIVEPTAETIAQSLEGEHPLKDSIKRSKELASAEAKKTAESAEWITRINGALAAAGVKDQTDDRLEPVYASWNRGDFADALAEAKLIGRKGANVDEEQVGKLVEERVHKALQEKGFYNLDQKTGTPSTAAISKEFMLDLYKRADKGDDAALAEFRKRRPEMDEMLKKGEVDFFPQE